VALDLGVMPNGHRKIALVQSSGFNEIDLSPNGGNQMVAVPDVPTLTPNSKVEIRELPKRYVFIDGKPLGQPLD
jgi:hypothetical protein